MVADGAHRCTQAYDCCSRESCRDPEKGHASVAVSRRRRHRESAAGQPLGERKMAASPRSNAMTVRVRRRRSSCPTTRRERAGALPDSAIELHRSESEGYFLNITAPEPKIFVMWRMIDSEDQAADGPGARPQLVTVSYNEAARLLDGGERSMRAAAPRNPRLDAALCRRALPTRAEAQGSPQ